MAETQTKIFRKKPSKNPDRTIAQGSTDKIEPDKVRSLTLIRESWKKSKTRDRDRACFA